MNIENAKSQMRKGMLEYCVLLLLKHRPSYASDIIQQLKNAELLVVEGTLYPLLTRLKNDGLLQYEWQESTQGPPRKYYALSTLPASTMPSALRAKSSSKASMPLGTNSLALSIISKTFNCQ